MIWSCFLKRSIFEMSLETTTSFRPHGVGDHITVMKLWLWRKRNVGGHVCRHGHHDSWHDGGIITMFSLFHATIMVWLSRFPCFFKIKFFIRFFSNRYQTPFYGSLDWSWRVLFSKLPSHENGTNNTPETLTIFFCHNQTANLQIYLSILSVWNV